MKGKNFFQLFSDLDVSERRQLFHLCKKSDDKRYRFLEKILRLNPETEMELNMFFQHLKHRSFQNKKEDEKDRMIRRLIDFFSTGIENLKIREYLQSNEKMYAYILTQVYLKKNFPYIFDYYSDWLFDIAGNESDSYMQASCLEMKISYFGKAQKMEDLHVISKLAIEKYHLINRYYHQKQAEYFNILSGLYLDDIHTLERNIPTDAELDAMVSLSSGLIYAAVYRIAQARFHYDSVSEFLHYTGKAKNMLRKFSGNDREKEKVMRRLYYLQMEVGFHLGFSVNVLVNYGREVNRINELYGYPDTVGFFFYIFFLVLDKKETMAEQLIKTKGKIYFNEENDFFRKFIIAYISFRRGRIPESQHIFHELAYSENYYISLWSRLIEIIIHYEKGNSSFCKTLIARAERFMDKHSGKPFNRDASHFLLNQYKIALNKKLPVIKNHPAKFSPFHRHLLKQLSFASL